MNRDLMKGIVIFGIGAGLGATITNVLLRNKYDIILKEEIEAIREAAISREKRMNRNDQDSCVDENGMPHKRYDENGRVLTPNKDRYNRIVRRYNNTETATELAEPDTRRVMTEDELEYRRCEKMSRHEDDTECCGYPYVITVEQFNEENNHFDKITLSYYEDDDTLTDENDEMIQDRESVIGVDALRSFGEGSEDPEVVYVRNDSLRADFEVVRLSKSYSETVLGTPYEYKPKEEVKVKEKKVRTRKKDRRSDPDEE